jgi:hypothetical protein
MNLQHLIKTGELVKHTFRMRNCELILVRSAPLAGRIKDHTDMCVVGPNKDGYLRDMKLDAPRAQTASDVGRVLCYRAERNVVIKIGAYLWGKYGQPINILDFRFSPCSETRMFSFWVFPRRLIKFCRRFGTLCQVHLQRLDEEWLVRRERGIYIYRVRVSTRWQDFYTSSLHTYPPTLNGPTLDAPLPHWSGHLVLTLTRYI